LTADKTIVILLVQNWRKEGEMDEIRPTWRLAWGLWWRILLISVGVSVVIGVILFLVGISFVPWRDLFGAL